MIVRLVRLPDIDSDRQLQQIEYLSYGRFAILLDGSFWLGDLHTSHPTVTKIGWYWAVYKQGDLAVSARGAGVDGEALFGKYNPTLARLIEELVKRRFIRKPESITVEK